MNLVDLVFEEMAHNQSRERTTRRRWARKGLCTSCGHDEDYHTWTRDGAPCGGPRCRCDNFDRTV